MSVATKLKSNAGKLAKRKTLWQNAGGGREERLCAFWMNFQKNGQIVQQKSKLINLISIVNYELYQCGSTTESTTDSASNDTSNSTTDGLQIEQQTVRQTVQQKVQQSKNSKKSGTTDSKTNSTTDRVNKSIDSQSDNVLDLPETVQQNNGKTVQQIGHKQEYNIILSPNVDNISSPPKGKKPYARARAREGCSQNGR